LALKTDRDGMAFADIECLDWEEKQSFPICQ